MLKPVLLSPPDVGLLEEEAVGRAIRSGWVAPVGPEVDAFEFEMAEFVGVEHAVALASGTAALHLGLLAAGVKPGSSVVTSSMTFVATANAIKYVGANPVFVDSLEDGTPNPNLLSEAIMGEHQAGRVVSAVVPVDIYGRSADYTRIMSIAQSFGIPVLGDSAEALGASHAGRAVGAWGDAAALSFNGNKIMTSSGGGMLLSSESEVVSYVRFLATQARNQAPHYEHSEIGFNYRMSNVLAALARAQLSRLPEMIARRRFWRHRYREFFSEIPGVSLLPGDDSRDNCWLTSILIERSVTGWGPMDLRNHLERVHIESRLLWKPMHLQPLYRDSRFVGGRVAEDLFDKGLALPSGSAMTESDMDRVLEAISNFVTSR